MAALCDDTGDLPFSHAAEHELLPHGWSRERLTRDDQVASPFGLSGVLRHLPEAAYDYVLVGPQLRDETAR